jgi:hypothetical protein
MKLVARRGSYASCCREIGTSPGSGWSRSSSPFTPALTSYALSARDSGLGCASGVATNDRSSRRPVVATGGSVSMY